MVIFVSYLESHPSLGPTLIRGYMFVSLVAEEAPSQNRIRVPGSNNFDVNSLDT
jgi:hypothetical protein